MKRFLTATTLSLLFGCYTFAQNMGRSGIYLGASDCDGKQAKYKLELVVNPDNSLHARLSEFSPDSDSKTPTRTREFRTSSFVGSLSTTLDLVESGTTPPQGMTSRSQRRSRTDLDLSFNAFSYDISARIDYPCRAFQLKRDAKASEKLISRLKKEREAFVKAAEKKPALIDISKLTGFWMSEASRTDYRLIVENNQTLLQIIEAGSFIPLAPEKLESAGTIIFRVNSNGVPNREFDKVAVSYKRGEHAWEAEYLDMFLVSSLAGKRSPNIRLKKPTVVNSGSRRLQGKEAFVYRDWQHRKYDGYFLVKDAEAQKRLRQTIDMLYEKEGWRCLAQNSALASPNKIRKMIFEEGGVNRLYLIYSPYGNSGLVYEAIPAKTYGYVNADGYDYPLVETEHRDLFRMNTVLSFSVQPSFTRPYLSSQEVPVSIFIFGRTLGDYGSGCEYYAAKEITDQNFRAQVIGKIVLAFLLEYGRRVSNEAKADIPQLATTLGRNETVKSLLHDLLPNKSSEELDYVTRWVTLAMSGDFRAQNYARDAIRENIVQRAAKENPQYKFDAQVMDLLLDLVLQRKGW